MLGTSLERKGVIIEVIVTLFEGHYSNGVGALLNSLYKSGFKGKMCIGYKGHLPEWANQMAKVGSNYTIGEISVEFISLEVDMHFGYYKPTFMKSQFQKYQAEKVYYFDPDIVVNSDWQFFTSWTNEGVALCIDAIFPFVYRHHPWRGEWRLMGKEISNQTNDIDYYVNSGFVGVSKNTLVLLERWERVREIYANSGRTIHKFEQSDASSAYKGDQDLLNAAITITPECKYSIIGEEGMGFRYPAYLMSHAISGDGIKPWKKNFLKTVLLKGAKPSIAETDYYNNCDFPIQLFSKNYIKRKKRAMRLSRLIARFLHN